MFDIGWPELIVVAVVTLIVVGPKEIPRVLRTVTYWVRKARTVAREFQSSLDEMAREAELDDLKKDIEASADRDLEREMEQTIDPSGAVGGMFKDDPVKEIEDAVSRSGEEARAATETGSAPEGPAEPEPAERAKA